MTTCVICFEKFNLCESGVECSDKHFICKNDLSQFLAENVLTQIFKLRNSHGKIECPCDGCSANLNPLLVYSLLGEREQARYTAILTQIIHEKSSVVRLRNAILDQLTLKCPKCKIAVDPMPDACSAVMCLNCGSYYCNYCFIKFDSGDTQVDRANAHTHVATHKVSAVSEEQDAFLSEECVKSGQRLHQNSQLHKLLTLAMTSVVYGVDGRHDISLALILCYSDLQDMGISALEAWYSVEKELMGDQVVGDLEESLLVSTPVEADIAGSDDVEETSETTVPAHAMNDERQIDVAIPQNNKKGGMQLVNAIGTLNSTAVTQILHAYGSDLDVDFVDPYSGFPVTSLAILAGQEDATLHLLGMHADIFKTDRNGRSVFYIAIESGNKKLLEFILATYPDIDINTPVTTELSGYVPIHVAVRYKHGHFIRLLISHGASLDVEEMECQHKPLALALILGHEYEWVATELILCGADFLTIQPAGRSAVFIAVERGLCALLTLMQTHSGMEAKEFSNQHVSRDSLLTMLQVACAYKQTAVVSQLIDMGADINAPNAHGHTPLCTTIVYDHAMAAIMLIKVGAQLIPTARERRFPIYLAIERGMLEVVREFLSHGVDVNASTAAHSHDTPLHVAILCKQQHLIPMLLESGADVNATDGRRGLTALLLAVVLQDELTVRLLIPLKPDVHVFNSQGRNCVFIAAEKGNTSILQLLFTHWEIDVNTITQNDNSEQTALHVACLFDRPHVVRYLLYIGADVHRIDSAGHTPLDKAREASSFACESVIMEHLSTKSDI